MKHGFLNHASFFQVLEDDALQQSEGDAGVPHALGVYHHDGATGTHAQTGCFTAFHARGAEEESFALQERGQSGVDRAASAILVAEVAGTDQHVPGVRLHLG